MNSLPLLNVSGQSNVRGYQSEDIELTDNVLQGGTMEQSKRSSRGVPVINMLPSEEGLV